MPRRSKDANIKATEDQQMTTYTCFVRVILEKAGYVCIEEVKASSVENAASEAGNVVASKQKSNSGYVACVDVMCVLYVVDGKIVIDRGEDNAPA